MANDGSITFDARLNTNDFQKEANSLGSIVKGLGIFAVLQKGFQLVTDSMDASISRYDALNKFPRVMEQMGYGADVAESSMNQLSDGIQGLPTTLDEIVQNTQQLTIATGSLETGTDSALALNNAFLASGASTADASRGMTQYIQMLRTGTVDMQSWKTLQETMPYALQKTAEAFGYTGASASNDLYAALQSGETTMEKFNSKMIELDGGLNGFAEVAKTATGGIGTAMTNLKSRTVIGVTAMVEAFDSGLSQTRFKSIENIINSTGIVIRDTLKSLAPVIEGVAANLDTLAPIALTVATAFAAYKIITPAVAGFKALTTAVSATKVALMASNGLVRGNVTSHTMLTAALASETVAEKVRAAAAKAGMTIDKAGNLITAQGTAATAAETANVLASGGALTAKTVIVALLSGQIGIATAAQWLWNAAMAANPIGIIIIAIAALIAGIIALVSWFNKSNAAYNEQKEEVEALATAQEEYNNSLDESTTAFNDNMTAINAAENQGNSLVSTLKSMVDENGNLTVSQEEAQRVIDDLNKSYEGLNLSYDKEKNALSASTAEVEKYVAAKNNISKTNALEERRAELAQEQATLEAKIAEITEKETAIKDNNNLSTKEKNKLLEELSTTTKEYKDTQSALSLDIQANQSAIDKSTDKTASNTVNKFRAMNGATTENGENLKQLAKKYHLSTDQILSDMEAQGISMDEWANKKQDSMTKEGASLEQVAAKWGMSTEQVKSYMNDWGMSLDVFDMEMESTHTKAGLSIENLAQRWGISTEQIRDQMAIQGVSLQEWSDQQDANTQKVINSFKKIPEQYELSATEMTNILNANAENYSAWTQNMALLSETMSAESIAELQKLGPEANSAIEEMIADPSKAQAFEESILNVMSAGANGAQTGSADVRFTEAGTNISGAVGEGISQNEEITTAATQMVTNAQTAANNAVANGDFNSVGQNIATQIVSGVQTSDMSGISTAIGTAINAGTYTAKTELFTLQTAFTTQFNGIRTSTVTIVSQMMNSIATTISIARINILIAARIVSNSFINGINDLPSRSVSIAQNTMSSMINSISGYQAQSRASGYAIGNSITDGMVAGLDAGKQNVYNKATEIANTAANSIRQALDIHSPSRVATMLFELFGDGMVVGLVNSENGIYRAVDNLIAGVVARAGEISNSLASAFTQRLSLAIDANQLSFGAIPQTVLSSANAAAGTVVNYYFEQTNISETAADPGENSRNAESLMRRATWGIK